MNLITQVADYIGLSVVDVINISQRAPRTYRRYKIPKKTSGSRVIDHPAKATKAVQYAIMDILLSAIKIHASAMAYIRSKGSPILKNAAKHSKYRYSVRVDFEDFFHSIQPKDLHTVLNSEKKISKDELDFLTNSLFIRMPNSGYCLAIGAPSSPMISNIVMKKMDEKILAISKKLDPSSQYTRYADDIVFSTNVKGTCFEFYENIRKLVKKITSPKLHINEKKTVFASRGSRRLITGLVVTHEGKVSIGRKNKRYLRKLLFDLSQRVLTIEDKKYLQGYLAYVLDVEPEYYNRLTMKYGGELLKIARDLN